MKTTTETPPLESAIIDLVQQYFATVDGHGESGFLHAKLISRVERELLSQVLDHTDNNQSQSARILGLSRTTLRKKMQEHGLSS